MNTNPKARDSRSQLKLVGSDSTPRAKKNSPALGVVDQVRAALHPKARTATFLGFLLGGFVPLASYVVAHYEYNSALPFYTQSAVLFVLGGLLFSARTVYAWSKLAFQSPGKALGFVVLMEGVMVTSHTTWLAVSALIYLIAINGVATGCNLSLYKAVKE